ncbi:MAG: hypothetical protein IIY99_01265 [Firmicutes bacterium]|nr:hypothetical protein [Bacillota bacterium]
MAKHLFLEGPIQSGKSTLIKNCLREFGGTPGGFSCKRYLDESGSIRAFGLVSPTDFDVDGVYDPQIHGDPDNGIRAKDPGIFLIKGAAGMKADTDAFIRAGIRLLDEPKHADLILMDEIGGVELMSDEFREKLDEVLAGNIPCIGVLKQQSHAKVMQKHHGGERKSDKADGIIRANEQLRKDIVEKYGGIIVPFDREGIEEVRLAVMQFLKEKASV